MRGGEFVKEKDKHPIIVPYAYNIDGNLMGNPAAHIFGFPVYVNDQPEDEVEEDLL
jgi:hypothetical protein